MSDVWDDFIDPKSLISLVNDKVSLATLFNRYKIALEDQESSTGWAFKSYCPLPDHDDSSPSFGYNPLENCWNCFGCKRGGGPAQFVHFMERISLEDAANKLLKDFVSGQEWKAELIATEPIHLQVRESLMQCAKEIRERYRQTQTDEEFLGLENSSRAFAMFLSRRYPIRNIDELNRWKNSIFKQFSE